MIRPNASLASLSVVALLSLSVFSASAQQQAPATPAPAAPAAAPSSQTAPAAPARVPAAPAQAPTPMVTVKFPKASPGNFTAATPTKETVESFLNASWGYSDTRVWQVQGILKTRVPNISKVVVLIGDKTGKQKMTALQFFVLPDGKHLIAGDSILPFGANPFSEDRATLQQQADGPYRGASDKSLEIVEFTDFQCPHCKQAQTTMNQLLADFPKARIVFQNYPLERIHPEAKLAASYGVCVTKLGGSTAFFQFAGAVFDAQAGLATPDGATLTLNSAVTKAGLDPTKVAACAATPATSAEVEKSVKLAQSLDIVQTPSLMVNGRQVPLGNVPYEMVKKIVQYQAKLDGVATQ